MLFEGQLKPPPCNCYFKNYTFDVNSLKNEQERLLLLAPLNSPRSIADLRC